MTMVLILLVVADLVVSVYDLIRPDSTTSSFVVVTYSIIRAATFVSYKVIGNHIIL